MILFYTDNIEVAYLKTLTKDNIMQFYKVRFTRFSLITNSQIVPGLATGTSPLPHKRLERPKLKRHTLTRTSF